jgi:hypothetical protein
MNLKEMAWGGMDWFELAQDRDQWRALVNTIMKIRVPQNVGIFLSISETGGFSRQTQFHGFSYKALICVHIGRLFKMRFEATL